MTPETLMAEVEQALVPSLVSFCRNCFSEVYLPSHDVVHHTRTWFFARKLVPFLAPSMTQQEIENLALACLLHDTGMVETLDQAHGSAGKKMAEAFIAAAGYPEGYFAEALEAILLHDDKEYRRSVFRETLQSHAVFTLLTLADDLDALGAVGVFRYYEIYLLRGVQPEALPDKVLANLEKRYDLLRFFLEKRPDWNRDLRERYSTIYDFYLRLREEGTDPPVDQVSRPAGVLTLFEREIRQRRVALTESHQHLELSILDGYARHFFTAFYAELEQIPVTL